MPRSGREEDDCVAEVETVIRPPLSSPQRCRTAAGTDICPLLDTRNSAWNCTFALPSLGMPEVYQVCVNAGSMTATDRLLPEPGTAPDFLIWADSETYVAENRPPRSTVRMHL
jgi:hypothetical protein